MHTFAIACIDDHRCPRELANHFAAFCFGVLENGCWDFEDRGSAATQCCFHRDLCCCQSCVGYHSSLVLPVPIPLQTPCYDRFLLQHAVTGWFGQSGYMILGASQVLWYFGVWRHLETWSRGFCPKMSQDFADVVGVIGVMVLLAVLRLSHIIVEVRSKLHFTDNWHALIEFGVRFPCRFHALSKAVVFEIAVLEFSGWYWWKFLMARARTWGWNPRRIEDFEFILLSSNEEWNMWNSLATSLCFYFLSFYFGDIVLQTQFGGRPKPCRCMMNRLCFQIFQLFRIFVTKLWKLHRVAREVDPSKLQGAAGQKGTMAQNRDAALWRSDFHFCFPFSFLILTC